MKKFFPWPGMVVVFILGNVTVCAVTVAVAMRAGDRGVEPEYYQKAMHWDQAVAAQQASDKLGWRIVFREPPAVGNPVRVRVVDKSGNEVDGATIVLEAFHHATASQRFDVTLSSGSAAGESGEFAPDRPGLWEFRWKVEAPSGVFEHEHAVDVLPASQPMAHAGGVG